MDTSHDTEQRTEPSPGPSMETVLTEPNDPLELGSVSPTSESQTVSPATQTDDSVIKTNQIATPLS